MHSIECPKCEEEMEDVVGFPGYVWCRDCHITKKVQAPEKTEEQEGPEEVTTEICEILEG